MCEFHEPGLEPLDQDEYVLDTPVVREFIERVRFHRQAAATAANAVGAIEPYFTDLMSAQDWLPEEYQHDAPQSSMGGGIGQWLLFRAADRSLSLFSLVVPTGSRTPIHDHLAWGLIGLYRGNQDEEFFRPDDGHLVGIRRRALEQGDWYALLPPEHDIHRVTTTSAATSVSVHLLANDTGCVSRHVYDESTGATTPFRSGWVNSRCG